MNLLTVSPMWNLFLAAHSLYVWGSFPVGFFHPVFSPTSYWKPETKTAVARRAEKSMMLKAFEANEAEAIGNMIKNLSN